VSNPLATVLRFYLDGFRNMKLGKTLWLIILIKLFILFIVLKIFFFPNLLNSRFDNDREKADFVLKELTERHTQP
jgi:hypothetical protein